MLWNPPTDSENDFITPELMRERSAEYLRFELEQETLRKHDDPKCNECGQYLDASVAKPDIIWLHAHRYTLANPDKAAHSGEELKFEAPLPDWACFNNAAE